MATITGLVPSLFEALDTVSRELVGFIPSVTLDSTVERAAVGQPVLSHVAPVSTSTDLAPGVTAPNDGDQTIGNVSLTISKAKGVAIRWNGENERAANTGAGADSIRTNQFAQAMRTLVNEIEADVALAAQLGASRAFGSAGTAPFSIAGDYRDASNALRILLDNGSPTSDAKLVISTGAGANLRGVQGGRGVNVEGSAEILRQGVLLDVHGFQIRESAAVRDVTRGTGASWVAAAAAVGSTVISLSGGTGTVLAGDVVTFAGDNNRYVVAVALAGGTITLAALGLRVATPAGVAMTVGANYSANMAFDRAAIILATRAPALPGAGDMADDRMVIQDPRSGLAFEVSLYKQYRQIRYEVAMAWGMRVVKSAHVATLLG